MRAQRVAVAAAALTLGQAADAQSLAERVCAASRDGRVDPVRLRNMALTGVDIDTMDADKDGQVSAAESFNTLTLSRFCEASRARPEACSQEGRLAMTNARNVIATFFQKRPGVQFSTIRAPDAEEVDERPGLADEPWAPLLDERGRYVRITCTSAERPPEPAGGIETAGPATRAAGDVLRLGTLVVSRDVDGLTAQRGPEGRRGRLKAVPQAELGLVDDDAASTRTVSINGSAGLRLADLGPVTLIPFVQYVRTDIEDEQAGTDETTGKLGLGLIASAFFGRDQFDFAPLYAKDLESRAEVLAARFSWRPGFLYDVPSFRGSYHFACRRAENGRCLAGSGLAVRTDFQMLASFGTVLRDGGDPDLADGREHLRVGPSAGLFVYGLDGLVRDLSLDVTYRHLFGVSGEVRRVTSLKAGLNYWVAGSEHVSIRYGYERGRDEETLERFDLWRLGFGVRF